MPKRPERPELYLTIRVVYLGSLRYDFLTSDIFLLIHMILYLLGTTADQGIKFSGSYLLILSPSSNHISHFDTDKREQMTIIQPWRLIFITCARRIRTTEVRAYAIALRYFVCQRHSRFEIAATLSNNLKTRVASAIEINYKKD